MRATLALAAALAVCWLLSATVLSDNLGSRVRFVADEFDLQIYMQRGAWAHHGLLPYRETFSEYPNVATYLFGLPYFLGGDTYASYRAIFSLVMCVCLGATIVWLQQLRPGREALAYLMLLPAPLYFTLNRFDLLASLLVLISLWCLQRDRPWGTGIGFALAVLTKWYPAFLLPLFLSYAYRRDPRMARTIVIAFAVACAVVVVPTVVGVGLRPVLLPYAFHAGRGLEMVSLPALAHVYAGQWFGLSVPPRFVSIVCLGGVLLTIAASVRARVQSIEGVVCWSVIVLSVSVLLSTVWSPQWMLWVMPPMILIAHRASDVAWLIAYGVVGYVVFPLIYDGFKAPGSIVLHVGTLAVYVILIRTIVVAYRQATGAAPVPLLAPTPASS